MVHLVRDRGNLPEVALGRLLVSVQLVLDLEQMTQGIHRAMEPSTDQPASEIFVRAPCCKVLPWGVDEGMTLMISTIHPLQITIARLLSSTRLHQDLPGCIIHLLADPSPLGLSPPHRQRVMAMPHMSPGQSVVSRH